MTADRVAALEELLAGHRYSASPWRCRCGAALDNANLHRHIAEVLVEAGGR